MRGIVEAESDSSELKGHNLSKDIEERDQQRRVCIQETIPSNSELTPGKRVPL